MINTTTVDILPLDALAAAAACLKVLAHPVRLRIVDILLQGDFTVREIATMCDIQEHQICEHLRLMQNCGLLSSERHGRTVHYKVESPQLPSIVACVREHCGTRNIEKEISQ
jgi:ArsR family transcriptional regulator, zinc-responsive transcriptional repressor